MSRRGGKTNLQQVSYSVYGVDRSSYCGYLHIQQIQSNINIHFEFSFDPPDELKLNTHSRFYSHQGNIWLFIS